MLEPGGKDLIPVLFQSLRVPNVNPRLGYLDFYLAPSLPELIGRVIELRRVQYVEGSTVCKTKKAFACATVTGNF